MEELDVVKRDSLTHLYAVLQYFEYSHLPEKLQAVSRPIGVLAFQMAATLPNNAETATGLRKLLEAKDALVRAALQGQ